MFYGHCYERISPNLSAAVRHVGAVDVSEVWNPTVVQQSAKVEVILATVIRHLLSECTGCCQIFRAVQLRLQGADLWLHGKMIILLNSTKLNVKELTEPLC